MPRAPRKIQSATDYARWFASQGGKTRAEKLTAEQRRDIARKAARARWKKKSK